MAANFYDANYRGVDWPAVRREFEGRVQDQTSPAELRRLLRTMLAKLNNSHTGVLTRSEFQRTRFVLPFFFKQIEGRIYISYVFKLKNRSTILPIEVGDEILSVDGAPADKMRPSEVTHLDDIMANPYLGDQGSVARVKFRRREKLHEVQIPRVDRAADVLHWDSRPLAAGGYYLRLLTLGQGTIPNEDLPRLLRTITEAKYLILDLRHCVGGDASLISPMAGLFLGPEVEIEKILQRGQTATNPQIEVIKSTDPGFRFQGQVVVLIDRNSESGPEALSAVLQDYGRAILVGANSRGAWNGWSKATALPHGVGMIAVPYTRHLSPKGHDYEGRGVAPDKRAVLKVDDLLRNRDTVLEAAVSLAQAGTN